MVRAMRMAAGAFFLLIWASPASAGCTVGRAELPVTMVGRQPLVPLTVNGKPALFMIDSGAFFSLISRTAADRLGLQVRPAPFGFFVTGFGGAADVSIAKAKTFGIAGHSFANVDFLVGGSDVVEGGGVGVIGQNVLRSADVEYDLGDGAVRLMYPKGCSKSAMAYWAGDKVVGVEPLRWADAGSPHTRGVVTVNGIRLQAMFDTGSGTSMLSAEGAKRAGVPVTGPDVEPAGYDSGIGRRIVRTWIAPVKSFAIGGEEVRHTRLRISDTDLDDADMLIGADFFLSHRVYVANTQRTMYFTYNGGPVFDLSKRPSARDEPADPSIIAVEPGAPGEGAAKVEGDTGLDAGALARRGAASAARRDLAEADADFTSAIALAPREPAYLRQRARVRLEQHRPALARGDLDAALQLAPQDVEAMMLRAKLRLFEGDRPGAADDLHAAVKADTAPRLDFAETFIDLDRFPEAVAQFDRWIAAHPADANLARARNDRCWARALGDLALDAALADCNAALRLLPGLPSFLDSRGLVRLRRGEFALAIADYDSALSREPKIAWSLYGRGVARIRTGRKAEGEADLAASAVLAPKLADRAKALGVTP